MLQDFKLINIVEPLVKWYQENARALPWRNNPTPYQVWVSEIMLQQTRVEAVKPYYERFISELPGIKALAECEEEHLLKLWEGLGYYSRVRNMQVAAQRVIENFGGCIPADFEELLKLKGIGRYTAGAVASIAYQIPVPAVDGNVLRVIARITADDSDIMKQSVRTAVEHALQKIMPQKEAGTFNQALMELGATVCLPNGEPLCSQCPVKECCQAKQENCWQRLPVKSKAKSRKVEEKTVFIIQKEDKFLLRKRTGTGLLAGLYELPNTVGYLSADEVLEWLKKQDLLPIHIQKLEAAKHIFSHVEWRMIGYFIRIDELSENNSSCLFADEKSLQEHYPIPAAFSTYTRYMKIRLGKERLGCV